MDSPDGVEPDASSSAAERDGPADAKKPRIGASPAKELAGQDGARNGPEADQMSDVEVQKAPSDGTDLVSYQIAFRNVPRAAKEGDFMNACKAAGVDASSVAKVKKAKKWDYAFVTFASKEARDAAMEKLAGCQIKDQAVQMESLDDNWRRDREQQGDNRSKKGRRGMSGSKNKADPNDTRTPQERLADQVTPLWRIPYSEQLAEKTKVARDVLTDVGKQLSASAKVPDASVAHKTMVGWVEESQLSNDGLPCPLQEIVPSPSATNYRTKCEFSFGLDPSGKRTLGFLLGLFKDGLTAVLDASECLHVSKAALQIRAALQEYTENHEWPPYDRTAKEGVWRLVVVKSFSSSGESESRAFHDGPISSNPC